MDGKLKLFKDMKTKKNKSPNRKNKSKNYRGRIEKKKNYLQKIEVCGDINIYLMGNDELVMNI